ncbi:YjgN family protein [Sphingomonas sp. SRS2]|uniref:YjgN family protein n=1 Tax=Sphingomonas sp. SRS2 TaxID=133190 RepID=UPI0006184B39|nr:YjgN family protein [Sphingomonas sp. SRS2]KKC26495.1 membrane protein [Sphingomonas sp. SRS2]
MTDEQADSAFRFEGNWREFAPIAFTNLLLMIVTLGIYRFWATTRERRYLWDRTRFIGAPLEWTGTGKELLIGFVLVLILLGLPLFALQFVAQGLMLRGEIGSAIALILTAYAALLYLYGLARYRTLRYRLSRTFWHGIRGGSDDQGWGYAGTALWKTAVGAFILGVFIPWSMTSLWNDRWNRLSFGSHRFEASANWRPIIGRFLLFYLLPIVGCVGGIGVVAGSMAGGGGPTPAAFGAIIIGAIVGYAVMGLIAIVYYAAFLREAIGSLRLNQIGFAFTARTTDWIKLILGHIGLIVITLGIGLIFIGYRNWSFFIRHLEATGEVDLATLTQSTTEEPRQGEGLLDAFDVGAF